MTPAFWEGRRVFLTGHTGFKGSWLSLWLQAMGASVTGYALAPPSRPSLFDVAQVGGGMESITADVLDLEHLVAAVTAQQPEVVIHMAAQSLVRPSYDQPVETFATNVMGTVNLLEAVRRAGGVKAAIMVTSDKCYDNREWSWGYREIDPMGGFDPYSASKGCAELVTAAYRRSFFETPGGTSVASVRAGNVIGGGDWAQDRLVPDILRAFSENRAVEVRNPYAVRPWQHVLEPLAGYLSLAEAMCGDGAAFAEGWNFGPADDDVQPVSWIADRMAASWGNGVHWVHDGGEHPHEATWLKLDCSKARSRLGWKPRLALGPALDWVAEWHRAYLRGEDMRAATLRQIGHYEELGKS